MGIRKSSGVEYKYHYTYKTTNLVNGKMYIGVHSTNDLRDGYKGSGSFLFKAIKKYGSKNFHVDILKFHQTQDDAYLEELSLVNEEWVKRKDTYNIVIGGGKPPVQNRRGKDHPRYGIKHTPEQRLKNSLANKGRGSGTKNPAYKGFIYAYFNGVRIARFESTIEASKMLGISRGGLSGIINKKNRTRGGFEWIRDGEPVKKDKEFKFLGYVYQLDISSHDIVGVFANCQEAMAKTGVLSSQIGSCCNYKHKTAGGYCWTRNLDDFKTNYHLSNSERRAAAKKAHRAACNRRASYIIKQFDLATNKNIATHIGFGNLETATGVPQGRAIYFKNINKTEFDGYRWEFLKKTA